jgi:ribosomal-protein-alanine N-acetyltransferase
MKPPGHLRVPAIIETPRLSLRPPARADAPAIFETYAQDPLVTRYLIWRPHASISETWAFLRRCEAA